MHTIKFNADEKNILIVDDLPTFIQLASGILKTAGYNVFFATSGEAALKRIEQIHIDLILLDVLMPEMDGYEVCRRIRQHPIHHDIPILFLTAQTEVEDIVHGFEAGGQDYINKPFNSSELLSRVENHLWLKHSVDQLKDEIENRKQIQAELETANRSKDKLFSIVAHDLNNPFTTLMWSIDLLKSSLDNISPEDLNFFVDQLHISINRIYELNKNLLSWARTQSSRIEVKAQNLSLDQLIDENIHLVTEMAEKKQISIIRENSCRESVYADKELLNTVIRNLLTNGLKFTKSGGKITLKAEKEKQGVTLEIRDTGVGMPPEKVEKLFQVGEKQSTYGTDNETGTGLGLILAKEFIELMGGSIYVESKEGEGTAFFITIPIGKN